MNENPMAIHPVTFKIAQQDMALPLARHAKLEVKGGRAARRTMAALQRKSAKSKRPKL